MADTGTPGDFPASPETAYFRAIEEVFLRLRGAPLSLSPADFEVAEGWYRQGIPLVVVEAALEEFFARRHERATTRRVSRLRLCRPAVEGAWAEVTELGASGASRSRGTEAIDVEARLSSLAHHLPATLPRRSDLVRRLQSFDGDLGTVEKHLMALDLELLKQVETNLDQASREALDHEVEQALKALASRLPAAELAAARERLRVQKIRARYQLPVLSLFSPEALAGAFPPPP